MRDFFLWLFKEREEPFDITLFSFWHIFYTLLIIISVIAIAIYLNRKSSDFREKACRKIAYSVVFLYISDFFIQPLFLGGDMNVDKLPFHICTLLCPVIALVQFNERFKRIAEPVAFLSIVSALMYITYPGSAIGTESPFCYRVIQTFLYHGATFAWGFMTISTGAVKPNIKNCYKSLIGIVLIAIWASFGNAVYSSESAHYDWFFLTGSTFPFIPPALMPLVVIAAVFGMVMLMYGIYYGVMHVINNKKIAASEKEKATV